MRIFGSIVKHHLVHSGLFDLPELHLSYSLLKMFCAIVLYEVRVNRMNQKALSYTSPSCI